VTTAAVAELKAHLNDYLEKCETDGPIVITRNGKAIAVLLAPYDEDDLERLLLGRSPRFQTMLDRSRQSIKEGKGLTEEEFWAAGRRRRQEQKEARKSQRRTSTNTRKLRKQ
jgi:prevent-host-death family protein